MSHEDSCVQHLCKLRDCERDCGGGEVNRGNNNCVIGYVVQNGFPIDKCTNDPSNRKNRKITYGMGRANWEAACIWLKSWKLTNRATPSPGSDVPRVH